MSSNSKEQISSRRSQEITVTDPVSFLFCFLFLCFSELTNSQQVDMASGVRTGNETSRGRSGGAGHHSAQQPVLGSVSFSSSASSSASVADWLCLSSSISKMKTIWRRWVALLWVSSSCSFWVLLTDYLCDSGDWPGNRWGKLPLRFIPAQI